ncbi:hypothetical protein KC887_05705 [Candidatus Kaiserbacteria bacterium]|nr:hypothetical protein [Candidatus Kaiserbacteria bacterium]
MSYKNKEISVRDDGEELTVQVSASSLQAMDIALRMADRVGGKYFLSEIMDGLEGKFFWIEFPNKQSLLSFRSLCC